MLILVKIVELKCRDGNSLANFVPRGFREQENSTLSFLREAKSYSSGSLGNFTGNRNTNTQVVLLVKNSGNREGLNYNSRGFGKWPTRSSRLTLT